MKYPLLADFNKTISRDYGVLVESAGVALRYVVTFVHDDVICLALHFQPVQFGPAFSGFNVWSFIFHSCFFLVQHFPAVTFGLLFSGPVFATL